jgi:hypothetical protein
MGWHEANPNGWSVLGASSFARVQAFGTTAGIRGGCETSAARNTQWMQIFSFTRSDGNPIDHFGSSFVLAQLMNPEGTARVACFHFGPGDLVGEHEAAVGQLFCVVDGEGWVSGADGDKRPIHSWEAAHWVTGERHAAGTESGLVAIVLEGNHFEVCAKPL